MTVRHVALRALVVSSFSVAIGAGLSVGAVQAADKINVGKSAPFAFTQLVIDIGQAAGIWSKYNLDIEIVSVPGEARLQQALAAAGVDVGIGSGPGLALMARGAPALGIAALARQPRNLAVLVGYKGPIRTVADLNGKRIGISTTGSVSEWLVKRIAIDAGWGVGGVKPVALGGLESMLSALRTNQVEGLMQSTEVGFTLEEKKEARVLFDMENYARDFHTNVVFARKEIIQSRPEIVSRFLQGLFASVAFMKANREKTIEVSMRVQNLSRDVAARTYDAQIGILTDDGRFDPRAIAVLKDSFIEMGLLDRRPNDDEMFTSRFVPVKIQ